jgi:hypothetical protein
LILISPRLARARARELPPSGGPAEATAGSKVGAVIVRLRADEVIE